MKKVLSLILIFSLLGCSSTKTLTTETPEPTIIPTETPKPTPKPTPEPSVNPTLEPGLYDITDLHFTCGVDINYTFIFYEDFSFTSTIAEFETNLDSGTYTQIDDTIYKLTFETLGTTEYFIYNDQTYETYHFFDDSFSLEDLHNYSGFSLEHGCIVHDPQFVNSGTGAYIDLSSTLDFNISELDFSCDDDNITYDFFPFSDQFEKRVNSSSQQGTYSQVNDITYQLDFADSNEIEYFSYNPINDYSFGFLDEPLPLNELEYEESFVLTHGCSASYTSSNNRHNFPYSSVVTDTIRSWKIHAGYTP